LHTAGEFFRQVVLITGQTDQPELHLDDGLDGGGRQISVLLEGQAIFSARVMEPKRAPDWNRTP